MIYSRQQASVFCSLLTGNDLQLTVNRQPSTVNLQLLLDSTRLLFDLQQVNEIVQNFTGCLEPEAISWRVTNGLVEKFGCAFARIWLVESDKTALRLVSSSGMYTRTDGSFARVPMGAFKIGKIAQNCIPFLSNRLSEEPWVRDRDWALKNGICGFAGYPLGVAGQTLGVLAVFHRQPMNPEFIEVLQLLCTSVAVAVENALLYQREKMAWHASHYSSSPAHYPLSDQLASILGARFILVGTEQSLATAITNTLKSAAETLKELQCVYCRLTYGAKSVSLEAVVPHQTGGLLEEHNDWANSAFGSLSLALACLGGNFSTRIGTHQEVLQILLELPYQPPAQGPRLRICCNESVLQMAFTHLAYLAGLTVTSSADAAVPLLTNQPEQIQTSDAVLWIVTSPLDASAVVRAKVDLSISPLQLRAAVEAVSVGNFWGIEPETPPDFQSLSSREKEIIALLAQGLRDREIASLLYISQRTVKFHINNIVTKLKARTRVQALHQAMLRGWVVD